MINEKNISNKNEVSRSNVVLVSIRDKVAETNTTPYSFVNKMCAGRYFLDLVKNNDNKKHYCLIYLGTFNTDNCSFSLVESRVVIDGDSIIDTEFKVGEL